MIIGYDIFGLNAFKSPSPQVRGVSYMEASKSIVDEIHMRERTDNSINLTSTKDDWQTDTRLKATFDNGSLSAGNVDNGGIPIESFVVKRREVGDLTNLTLATLPFVNDSTVIYTDYLQTNKEYIYSIIPFGQGLEGKPNEVSIESDFTGFFIVDKTDLTNIIAFDKFLDSGSSMVNMQLNQGRTEIRTLSRFPTVFYDDTNYHSFTLESVFLPDENARSNDKYQKILEIINKHIPVLIKGSDGSLFICDISSPRKSVVQNSYKGYDYFNLQIDATEIMELKEYIEE